ncbi:unnamed protein product [Schistosoma mattheei]|uniref:Uncharacterized protein n=1 Tax=Schistosoma mattheei TaxID=31246 RepID=A0A3P8GQ26_9TREM|nr:unnamed protein product [Schistosoma mattheei]
MCWKVVWSCCFATLDLSDGHADFFNCWWPTSVGRFVCGASILCGFSGAGRFKSSLKCSTHLFRCSSVLVITSLSLVFTGRPGLR